MSGALASVAELLDTLHRLRLLLHPRHTPLPDLAHLVFLRAPWQSCAIRLQVHDRQCALNLLVLLPSRAGESDQRDVRARPPLDHALLLDLLCRHPHLRLLVEKLAVDLDRTDGAVMQHDIVYARQAAPEPEPRDTLAR